jgi:hypothetical protein
MACVSVSIEILMLNQGVVDSFIWISLGENLGMQGDDMTMADCLG